MGRPCGRGRSQFKQQTWKARLRLWPVGKATLWVPHLPAYTCVFMCIHVYTPMYVHIHTCMCVHACVCTRVYMYMKVHIFVCVWVCMYTCVYVCV